MSRPELELVKQLDPSNEDEQLGYIEIPQTEFTRERLARVYQFTQSLLSNLSQDLGGPIDHLDIGTWNGDFLQVFTENHNLATITAIDINSAKIDRAGRQTILQQDLASKRLRLQVMDGTRMTFPDSSFDCVTSIEVLIALKGNEEDLFSEIGRVLKPGGVAIITFVDKDVQDIFNMAHFSPPKGQVYDLPRIVKQITQSFGDEVFVQWFGQMPITEVETATQIPLKKRSGESLFRIYNGALNVQIVYDQEGRKIANPLFWVGVIRKPL